MVFVTIIICLTLVLLWNFSIKRGGLAVKAYVYLASGSEGSSQIEANFLVATIDAKRAETLNSAMQTFARGCYGGKQLAMIAEARQDGFSG